MHAAQWVMRVGCALSVVLAVAIPAPAESWRVKVRGNGTDLGETPVMAEIKAPIREGQYVLQADGSGTTLPAVVLKGGGKLYLATILDHVAASATDAYDLKAANATTSGQLMPEVGIRGDDTTLNVLVNGALFLGYVYNPAPATKPYYFPVNGATGVPITRSFPMKKVAGEDTDHNHQRSMWFTHGSVNGFDFWASDPLNPPRPNYGTIKAGPPDLHSGSVLGLIRTTDDWLGPDGKRVCEDERILRVYATGRARVLDFDITLKASDGPVTFGDTKEGMFGLRVASSMDVKRKKEKGQGKITNAEGITDAAAWGKASPWVDYVGPVEGQTVGVAILNHPDSFRYPTTWHVRDYGLFAANPFGWHDFGMKKSGEYTIPAGKSIQFRYRVIFHKGDTDAANLPAAFQGYAKPPTLEVEPG